MKFSLSSNPSQHATKVVDFPKLDGGLNLWELDYRVDANQSPEMKNLWWQDGVLQSRDGQSYLYESDGTWGTGYTCASELFWDNAFFHIGDKICYLEVAAESPVLTELVSGVPENRGTFFRYNDWLYYKNKGSFIKITYDPDGAPVFSASNVADDAYTPIIVMNANPSSGSGDTYQPENRLSPKKTVQYDAAETTETVTITGDGSTTVFDLGKTAATDQLTGVTSVYKGITLLSELLYTVDIEAGTVTFTTAPEKDAVLTVAVTLGVTLYKLPATMVDAVLAVTVDGKTLIEGTDYTVDLDLGTVTFVTAPPVHNPAVNNTVEITYSKANDDAYSSVLNCRYAAVYGGDQNVCIVLGGCDAQPNAFFWNGNDAYSMNDSYWPMSFYQLAGDSEDGITGFSIQYGTMIVLKGRSVGKVNYSIEVVDDRNSISMTYTSINSRIGCDLPWTIQLVENNVVFCNTSGGVYLVRDSSSALENNIECISRNVNGTDTRPGLLNDVQITDVDKVCCFDDDNRYWLCANGHAYVWDYLLSSWKEPSWFYFTEIPGIAYFQNVDTSYHLDEKGSVTKFARIFADYGKAIDKVYQFPPQFFGTYDRLKDILHVILVVRADVDTHISIQYQSDYETRNDLTDIRIICSWKLSPRNLAYRNLASQKGAQVAAARRKPGCRHVRHFSMRLANNEAGQDLSVLSAQIYFRYLGRDR